MFTKKKKTKDLNCLNCGFPFSGHEKFCPECGQKNKGKKITFWKFIKDVFGGFFNWDSKFWGTVFPLIFKPGSVSKDYIEGKRARYTNPFRFYFATSFLFFLLLGLKTTINEYNQLNSEITEQTIELDGVEKNEGWLKGFRDSIEDNNIHIGNSVNLAKLIKFQHQYPEVPMDIALDSLKIEKSFSNRFWYSKSKIVNTLIDDKSESERFNKHLISYFSVALLFLLPILALIFNLLFFKKKYGYVANLVFCFHIQSVVFLILSTLLIISCFTTDIGKFVAIFTLSFSAYLLVAMLKFYKQNWFKTVIKFSFINISFSVLVSIVVILISIIALTFY